MTFFSVKYTMSCKSLFVLNVHEDVTEGMLKQKFSVAGKVLLVKKKQKGDKYYAYINFERHTDGKIFIAISCFF